MNAMRQTLMTGMLLMGILLQENAAWAGNHKGFQLCTLQADQMTVAQINTLANLGATMVRYPVYVNLYDLNYWLPKLDVAANACLRKNVILVICIFPQIPEGNPVSAPGDPDAFVAAWTTIARRYGNWGGHVWFDLCNEPNDPNWPAVALRAARAIRASDTRHSIIYPAFGTTTATAPTIVPLPGISNQIIEFHFYDWAQDVQFYNIKLPVQPPSVPYPSANRTQDVLRSRLQRVADVRSRYPDVSVYIGEVAIPRWHPNAGRFLRDFTSICDDLQIHLTVHAFREAEVWDYENFRVDNPVADPPANPSVWSSLTNWLKN
jgi:hypothetical protein